jgi:hypothetical protein
MFANVPDAADAVLGEDIDDLSIKSHPQYEGDAVHKNTEI